MSRLIDADALKKILDHHEKDCNPDHFDGHETFIDKIDAHDSYGEWQFANGFNLGIVASIVDTEYAPTIDAVPVVRCKDCEHYCKRYVLGDFIEDNDYYMACDMGLGELDDDWSVHDRVLPDDFCSRGERRKNGKIH